MNDHRAAGGARWTEGVRRLVLPNGVTVLIQRDAAAPAAAVVSHVRAGFFDEPDQVAGVSHVLEHMLFKGTPTRGPGDIARETKAAGGYLNAGTGYDHTSYYTVLPPDAFPVALDLQADAIRRSLIDPEELRRELLVIVEEAKRKLDTPSSVAAETLHALLFDVHRIRRWRIGTEAELVRLTREDVAGYYRSRYVPGRTIVGIVGNVDPEAAASAAGAAFGDWPGAPAALDPSPQEPARRSVRVRTLRGDVRMADLVVGWRGVPALHADAAPLDIAAAVLGSGRGSWLYRALRLPGVVSSIGAWHFAPTEVGVFSIAAELEPGKVERSLRGIAEEVSRLREDGPGEEDLARVRTLLGARWARQLESTEGRAMALTGAEALGDYRLLDEEFARLMAVDAATVRDAARRYLAPDLVSAVSYLPADLGEELESGTVARVFAGAAAPPLSPIEAPERRVARSAPVTSRKEAGVTHVELPGADLLLMRKAGVPLVSLGVYRRRTVPDTIETSGLGALAIRSAVRGAGDLDASQLAQAFERLGGGLSTAVTTDWFGFGTSVLAEHGSAAAGLLSMVFGAPRHDEEEVRRERELLAEDARQSADDMVRWPIQLALRAAFGPSGYGLPALGLPESVASLTSDLVRAWHGREQARGRIAVVAVGEIVPERFAESIATLFASGPSQPAGSSVAGGRWLVEAESGPATEVDERVKRQTALALAFPGPGRRDHRRYAAEVWAAISSGLGGRLFDALRDRRSLAYTVLASSWQRAGAGALLCYLATSPEREEEAREQFLVELARFREDPVAADELARAVNYLAGQAQVSRQTGSALAGEIAEAWLIGEGLSEIAEPARPFREVTARDIRELCAECLDPEARAEGIVRGAPTAALAAEQ